jgi:hypothetical protein
VYDPAADSLGRADDATLENAGGAAGTGVALNGSTIAAADFVGWPEIEPNDCAPTGSARPANSVANTAAIVKCLLIASRL